MWMEVLTEQKTMMSSEKEKLREKMIFVGEK